MLPYWFETEIEIENHYFLKNYNFEVNNAIFTQIKYRKIPNVSSGLIEVFKHFLGAYIRGGLISRGLIFGGHFVLVSEYQDLNIHCYISLLEARKVFLWAKIIFILF